MSAYVVYLDENKLTGTSLVEALIEAKVVAFDRRQLDGIVTIESAAYLADHVIVLWSKASTKSKIVIRDAEGAMDRGALLSLGLEDTPIPTRFLQTEVQPALTESSSNPKSIRNLILAMNANETPYATSGDGASLSERIATKVVERLSRNSLLPENSASSINQFYFGDWKITPQLNQIERGTTSRRLTPRSMEVLMTLIDLQGIPISKDQLLSKLWGREVVDNVIHRCISELRQALGDSSSAPIYIETISRKGYRAMVPIRTVES